MFGSQSLFGNEDLERLDGGALGTESSVYHRDGHMMKEERAGFPPSLGSRRMMRVGRPQWYANGERGEGRDWRCTLGLLAILVMLAIALAVMIFEWEEVGTVFEGKSCFFFFFFFFF